MHGFYLFAAGRGRFIRLLFEGDPVAWTILGVVLLIVVGFSVCKAMLKKNREPDSEGA